MVTKLSFVLLFVVIIFITTGVYLYQKVGDVGPAILPIKTVSNASSQAATIPPKKGQPIDAPLTLAEGFSAGIFATDVPNARDLEITKQNTVIVSQPSQGKVMALKDDNQDGIADQKIVLLENLDRPHGLALFNNQLFVAEETKLSRYNFDESNLKVTLDKQILSLPKGGRHFSRTIAFDKSGTMYVSIGSTCDVCVEKDPFIATVIVSDWNGKTPRVFAKGLRNAPFIVMNPEDNKLYGTEMGRDMLGDDLPPDEINLIEDNKDYGWPYCYGDNIHDTNFDKNIYKQNPCADKTKSLYNLQAHSAPLGLQFITSPQFPEDWQNDLLVSFHGSWNRSIPTGYKIVRLNRENGQIKDQSDFLTGFLDGSQSFGRPVDLAFDSDGYLFVSDDKAGKVYIIGKK